MKTNPDNHTDSDLASALAAAQAEMGNAEFDSTNPHFKSRYASLASVRKAVLPALTRHKIALVQLTNTLGERDVVITQLHGYGSVIESVTPIMMGQAKNPAQAYGSALTYARRYGMAAIAGIAADEDDDGNSAGDTQKMSQPKRPQNNIPADAPAKYIPIRYGHDGAPDFDQFLLDVNAELFDCASIGEIDQLYRDNRGNMSKVRSEAPSIFDKIGDAFEAKRSSVNA